MGFDPTLVNSKMPNATYSLFICHTMKATSQAPANNPNLRSEFWAPNNVKGFAQKRSVEKTKIIWTIYGSRVGRRIILINMVARRGWHLHPFDHCS